jgi:hypothetical protein
VLNGVSNDTEPVKPSTREIRHRVQVNIPVDPTPEATYANQVTATFSVDEVLLTFAQAFLPPRLPGQPVPESLVNGVIDAKVVTHLVMPLTAFVDMVEAFAGLATRIRELGLVASREEDQSVGH